MIAPIQSLQRAFHILYYVAGREEGSTVVEIANNCGLNKMTAYKIVRTLESERFLLRSESPLRFHLGHAVHELKYIDDNRFLLTKATIELRKAKLDMPDANFTLLQWEHGETWQRLSTNTPVFGRIRRCRDLQLTSYSKASSILFLAYAQPDEAREFFRKYPFEPEGRRVWQSRQKFDAFIDEVRRIGWAQPDFPDDIYYPRVAVPIWTPDGRLIAAAGAYMQDPDVSQRKKQRLISLGRRIATRLTKQLGEEFVRRQKEKTLPRSLVISSQVAC